MPPGSSSSGGFRQSVKRRVKKWLGPENQAPVPRMPSPQPPPERLPGALPPQTTPTHEPPSKSLAQTQHSAILARPVPSAGSSTSTVNRIPADDVQPADPESALVQAARKAGADAWTGLKVALGLVKESSDVFPPLKSAVAGFLGVVDIFEVSNLISLLHSCMALILF